MRAIVCREFGPPESLRLEDIRSSKPGPGQVLIRVAASGVNYTDVLSTSGRSQLARDFPMIPGVEAAGTITAVGEGVDEFVIGTRVLCTVMAGAFAEEIVAQVEEVAAIPDSMPFEHAAAFYIANFTTFHALVVRAGLSKGESLLVLGAGGGVGLAAVQMGKALGATVVAAASSEAKLQLARQMGADETYLYPESLESKEARIGMTADLLTKARSDRGITIGSIHSVRSSAGFDVVIDGVGGPYAEPALRALAWEGRYLSVGFAASVPSLNIGPLLFKNATLHGIQPSEPEYRLPGVARANLRTMFDWYETGRLVPTISRTFPLARAAEAMRLLLDRKATGRVVLVM